MNDREVLNTFDRQEVAWIEATVNRAQLVKTIAQNIKRRLEEAKARINLKEPSEAMHEITTALEFEQILEMIADEDIRAGKEQLKNN